MLALKFELRPDTLGMAVSPSGNQIGKLGAVAVIRRGLNYFLSMEIEGVGAVKQGEAALVSPSNKGDL